jgi:hypothetical protein
MPSFSLAMLAALSPLAATAAAQPPSATPVWVGIEHSRSFAVPAGAKAGDSLKPRIAHVGKDETLIPVHLHIAADGSRRIECREDHATRPDSPIRPEAQR